MNSCCHHFVLLLLLQHGLAQIDLTTTTTTATTTSSTTSTTTTTTTTTATTTTTTSSTTSTTPSTSSTTSTTTTTTGFTTTPTSATTFPCELSSLQSHYDSISATLRLTMSKESFHCLKQELNIEEMRLLKDDKIVGLPQTLDTRVMEFGFVILPGLYLLEIAPDVRLEALSLSRGSDFFTLHCDTKAETKHRAIATIRTPDFFLATSKAELVVDAILGSKCANLDYEQVRIDVFKFDRSNNEEIVDCDRLEAAELVFSRTFLPLTNELSLVLPLDELDVDSGFCARMDRLNPVFCPDNANNDKHVDKTIKDNNEYAEVIKIVTCSMATNKVYFFNEPSKLPLPPFCSNHIRCLWFYVALALTTLLIVALLFSCCITCCRSSPKPRLEPLHDFDESNVNNDNNDNNNNDNNNNDYVINDDVEMGLRRASLMTWQQISKKSSPSVLLLYSPDSDAFLSLIEQLKSFLINAGQCTIFDLFDDPARDPLLWLKRIECQIVIVESEGATKRLRAKLNNEVLNIPQQKDWKGGLFSIVLDHFLGKNGSNSRRKEEMIVIKIDDTEDLGLDRMLNVKTNFSIPSQLLLLLCLLHNINKDELVGDKNVFEGFHLELQLLKDAINELKRSQRLR